MASIAPIVQWWDEEESSQQSQWDAGIVDAGSESDATVFHLWNNRGNNSSVSDMINVDLTVRDSDGQTSDLKVAGQVDAVVRAQFFNSKKNGGQWGYMEGDVWKPEQWVDLKYDKSVPVISYNGDLRTIAGEANSGDSSVDKRNFSAIKLKLYAKPTATAGQVSWITRVSYQYV